MTDTPLAEAQAANDEAHGAFSESIDDMYLTFPVGDELYGVPINMVVEIVGLQRIMTVPDVPHYVKGVINLRGKVIPLMDVRLRFSMPERPYDDRTVVIVLHVHNAPIGLIVDGVSEVLDIPAEQIDRTHGFSGGDQQSVIQGLGRMADRVAILLDVGVLVSRADINLPRST